MLATMAKSYLGRVRTLYRNGRVLTPVSPGSTAFAVHDGTIEWVGGDDAVGGLPDADVVDLHGALVTPAFVDAHVHATSTGLALKGLDLASARSLAELLDRVARAAHAGRGRPILGTGWDESSWPERRPPTAAELDRASYGGAVYLSRVDVHSAVVSSALLAAVPDVGRHSGHRPDGWLTRDAHDAVRTAALAMLLPSQIRDAQRAMLRQAASLGIGSVHEMAGPAISSAEDLTSLLDLARDEPLPEVIAYWGELFGAAAARELGAVGAGGDLFCDGSLGSHTAALSQPYADRPDTSGALRFETGDLSVHIEQCVALNVQAGFHAIGDAAVDQVLDAFELASTRLGRPAGIGSRIEHAEFVRDAARLAHSGLVASVQPAFDATWGGVDGMYARRLGADRAAALNRFADLDAAGVPLAFGSDAPVTPLDPWGSVEAAIRPTQPDVGIPAGTAFAAHTAGGWRAAGMPGEGVLTPGTRATFAVWEAGALGADGLPSGRSSRPRCLLTVVRGRPAYQADA
jgi:predicted amidohydrolase YtcJ